jgi:glycosyltransferase involved in cell wall biosynthesis
MNILIINYEYPPIGGGAASASKYMAEELVRQGHFAGVLTSSYKQLKGETIEKGVAVYRCKAIRRQQFQSNISEMISFIFSASFTAGKLIRKWNIDHAVVFFSFPGGPVGLFSDWFYKIPYVVSLRGGDVPGAEPGLKSVHKLIAPLRKLILKNSTAVVANSVSLMELARKSDEREYKVIPNGIDTGFYCPGTVKTNSENRCEFLFVGRMQPQKNLFFLFDCISSLKNKTTKPFVFNIVGDGYQRAELERYAIESGIDSSVKFHGWLEKEELLKMYQNCDCLVNPSLYEGMSNVLLEAMACAMPVIASKVTGNDVLVNHGQNGFLFDLDKPDDLVQLLSEVINEPGIYRNIGLQARHDVQIKYSWKKVVEDYLSLFK